MTIDLRSEFIDFKEYLSGILEASSQGLTKPPFIHFGFYFDQDGWVVAYTDARTNASMDGEWSKHINSSILLERPHWHEASELADLSKLTVISRDGQEVPACLEQPSLEMLANLLGDFITSSVLEFREKRLFQALFENNAFNFCVEELNGLYVWPVNTDLFDEYS